MRGRHVIDATLVQLKHRQLSWRPEAGSLFCSVSFGKECRVKMIEAWTEPREKMKVEGGGGGIG